MDQNEGIAEYYANVELTKAKTDNSELVQELIATKQANESLLQTLREANIYLNRALDLDESDQTPILDKIIRLENYKRFGISYKNIKMVSSDEIAERLAKIRNEN